MRVEEVIDLLEQGTISLGSRKTNGRLPKPWAAAYPSDATGSVNAIDIHRDGDRALLAFSQHGVFYATCLIDGGAPQGMGVKWYFCDTDRLIANVECLLVDNDLNAEQRRRQEAPRPEGER